MPLSVGTRLGPYEILAPIGAGGMGEVYKARDTRLERTVAIKIATAKFSERFEREARAVAALNHPHICTLHDVGPDYLVMEYVEGQPLKGPLPIEKAVEYARQILDRASGFETGQYPGDEERGKTAGFRLGKGGTGESDVGCGGDGHQYDHAR